MDAFLAAIMPHLLELIAAVATATLAWAAAQARRRWGIEIEARHCEALHSALMTASGTRSPRGCKGAQPLPRRPWSMCGVPDALANLEPSGQHLLDGGSRAGAETARGMNGNRRSLAEKRRAG
jgi:hypothetical protein